MNPNTINIDKNKIYEIAKNSLIREKIKSIELSKKFNNKYNATLLYVNRYYNKRFVEEKSGEVNSQIIVLDNTLKLGNKKSLKFDIQHLSNDDDQKNWFGYGIEYNLNYNISVYHSNIVNYGNEVEGKPSYYSSGISYSKNSTRLFLISFASFCNFL